MDKSSRQVKLGAVLSYILIILNTTYGIVIAPYMLCQMGESGYGVYKTIASFSSTLLVLDMGIGSTVMRYTAKYRAEKRDEDIGNFAAIGIIEAVAMSVILLIVSLGVYFSIDSIYSGTFTAKEIYQSKLVFMLLAINMIMIVFENVLNGIITGCNQFIFSNGLKVFVLFIKIFFIVVILKIWGSPIAVAIISLAITLLSMCVNLFYILRKLRIKIKLIYWDKNLFVESFGYTFLMFLQTLAGQTNGNIDNIVIGAVVGTTAVTIYSFGIQLFNMFETLATSFSGLMLPSIAKKIADGTSNEELQEIVTKIGRVQCALLIGALGGFVVFGREFLYLWLGKGFEDVYLLSLIMMVPVILTLIQNVCLSILRAKNMMVFRTVQLFIAGIFNAIVTVIGTKLYGYFAAAVGTGLSILLFSVIMMNIYYHKRIGFRIFKFYHDVFNGLLLCALITTLIFYFINKFMSSSWTLLVIKICLFLLAYAVLLLFFGLNKSEKEMYLGKILSPINIRRK